jgi:hypothetical protein
MALVSDHLKVGERFYVMRSASQSSTVLVHIPSPPPPKSSTKHAYCVAGSKLEPLSSSF